MNKTIIFLFFLCIKLYCSENDTSLIKKGENINSQNLTDNPKNEGIYQDLTNIITNYL